MIFDTHAHYDDAAFDEDRDVVLEGLASRGVGRIVNCGASLKSSGASVKLAGHYDWIYAAVGVHPDEASELEAEDAFAKLEQLALDERVVAVGEIGLDYHWDVHPRELQREMFVKQWELAVRIGKPVVIHSRDAAEDTMSIVKEMYEREKLSGRILRADMHCYSYSADQAAEYLKMGLYFGVGGVATFKNAKKLMNVLEILPMDRILLETDCPYLAPEPERGSRNSSDKLKYVVCKLAELKGMEAEEVIKITETNAERFFGIK